MIDALRNSILIVMGLAVGLGAALFAADHQQPLRVTSPLFAPMELPLWAVVGIAFGAGALLATLAALGLLWSQWRTTRTLRRQVRDMESELLWLRNLPLETLPDDIAAVAAGAARRSAEPGRLEAADTGLTAAELLPPEPGEGGDFYEAFLEDGAGFDAVEAETYLGGATQESEDPYAVMFDQVDPAVRDMDEAQLYPAVTDRGRRQGS